jgi:hypothetical protein
MKIRLIHLIPLLLFTSCNPESVNTDCNVLSLYELNYFSGDAAEAFNISSNLPVKIHNQTVEYGLYNQWSASLFNPPMPYPFNEYFISRIEFLNDSLANVKFIHDDSIREYKCVINKCLIELESKKSRLRIELSNSGKELSEQRYVIYEYKLTNRRRDTFLFIEFRNEPFSSYEEVIKLFASENRGKYDSVAIERIKNKTMK